MYDHKKHPVSLCEVYKAKQVINKHLHPTSLSYYKNLSIELNTEIFIKHENHNPTGSFKIRGGINLFHHLQKDAVNGVITFSTGNHGLSIAQSASWFGIKATVVVPEKNNPMKNRKIKETGATLIEAGKTFEESALVVNELMKEYSLYYAHPANEPHLINGVGTEFIEIIEERPDVEAVILPVGAGSEIAAASVVLRTINPDIQIFAVQAEASKAAYLSWKTGKITSSTNTTFAGGFATGTAYELPFEIYKDTITDIILLTEDEIYEGIALAGFYTNTLLEGAGASTIMAALKLKDRLKNKKVVLQFSGSNASAEETLQAYNRKSFSRGMM